MKSVLIAAAVVAAGWTSSGSAQDAAAGAKVYADQKCGVCHSIAGKGNAKGPLDGVDQVVADAAALDQGDPHGCPPGVSEQ